MVKIYCDEAGSWVHVDGDEPFECPACGEQIARPVSDWL